MGMNYSEIADELQKAVDNLKSCDTEKNTGKDDGHHYHEAVNILRWVVNELGMALSHNGDLQPALDLLEEHRSGGHDVKGPKNAIRFLLESIDNPFDGKGKEFIDRLISGDDQHIYFLVSSPEKGQTEEWESFRTTLYKAMQHLYQIREERECWAELYTDLEESDKREAYNIETDKLREIPVEIRVKAAELLPLHSVA
ncbi:MAG: hypothetical protein COA78_16395 [Blastopirellula sp.]|nr:MAG: hypothetical protein COA78_16395 [Blastopirellula sp.]